MKTKQEQIEEMTKLIQAEYKQWLDVAGVIPEGTTYYAECLGCAIDSAEILYNVAGYRKTFTSDLASDMQNAFKEGYEKGCETCEQAWDNGYNDGYESGKEDGVKEFAEKVKGEVYPFLQAEMYNKKHFITGDLIRDKLLENQNIGILKAQDV